MRYFIGIDISKDHYTAYCETEQGEKVFEKKGENLGKGYRELLSEMERRGIEKEEVLIGVESSGNYHRRLVRWLKGRGYRVVILTPLSVKSERRSRLHSQKTDKEDARHISRYLRKNAEELREWTGVGEGERMMSREIERLGEEIGRTKGRIESYLELLHPRLLREVRDVYTKGMLRLLYKYPSAKKLREAKEEEIESEIRGVRGGRLIGERAKELKRWSDEETAIEDELLEELLRSEIERLWWLKEKKEELEERLKEEMKERRREEWEVLSEIKGIGEKGSARILGAIGEVRRFKNGRKLVAYLGLDPQQYESGRYKGESRISKRGNRWVRRLLYNLCFSLMRHNEEYREYFDRKRESSGSYIYAMVALINKFVRRLYRILISVYEPQKQFLHS